MGHPVFGRPQPGRAAWPLEGRRRSGRFAWLQRLARDWPWLRAAGAENSWRFDPKVSGGGILADAGDHLLDALLWSTGQVATDVAAVQNRLESGLDLVTAAAIRLADGTPGDVSRLRSHSGPLLKSISSVNGGNFGKPKRPCSNNLVTHGRGRSTGQGVREH